MNKRIVMMVTAILRQDKFVRLSELENAFGSDVRQVVDVLHWSGVIRSRNTLDGSDLEYQWVR